MNGEFITESKKAQFLLNEKHKVEIEALLRMVVEEKQAFIQPQYTLSQLASEARYSRNLLSAFFNQTLGIHFNDYINQLRIRHCKELIEHGYAHRFTLEGLAQQCGFFNRNTFTTAFKKFTGDTPSYYIRKYCFG